MSSIFCLFQILPRKTGVFRLTFDLYKVQPTDLQCSLAVRATLLETSSLSYDFRFSRVQHVLR